MTYQIVKILSRLIFKNMKMFQYFVPKLNDKITYTTYVLSTQSNTLTLRFALWKYFLAIFMKINYS